MFKTNRLDLPGLGTYRVNASALNNSLENKGRPFTMDAISFEYNPAVPESPDLVNYISHQSGKMRSLAASDLESMLQLAKQFINIGKPFTLEGVGSIQKKTSGDYEFLPALVTADQIREYMGHEPTSSSSSSAKYVETTRAERVAVTEAPAPSPVIKQPKREPVFEIAKPKNGWLKPVLAVLILAVIGVGIWGTYNFLIKKNKGTTEETNNNGSASNKPVTETPDTPKDTSENNQVPPGTGTTEVPASLPAAPVTSPAVRKDGATRFVLETTNKERGLKRHKQLIDYDWVVDLETRDSVTYEIVIYLKVPASDTARVKDSLSSLSGRRVKITP